MNSKRIIFLDYDGVLHPDAAYMYKGKPELRADGALFMWGPHLEQLLSPYPDVKIVLSTSWVRELRFSRAKGYLPPSLQAKVIGATWHSSMRMSEDLRPLQRMTWWDLAPRYRQIKRYVERAGLVDWLAIDDHPDEWAEADHHHLVKTDSSKGLSDPLVQKLIQNWLSKS